MALIGSDPRTWSPYPITASYVLPQRKLGGDEAALPHPEMWNDTTQGHYDAPMMALTAAEPKLLGADMASRGPARASARLQVVHAKLQQAHDAIATHLAVAEKLAEKHIAEVHDSAANTKDLIAPKILQAEKAVSTHLAVAKKMAEDFATKAHAEAAKELAKAHAELSEDLNKVHAAIGSKIAATSLLLPSRILPLAPGPVITAGPLVGGPGTY